MQERALAARNMPTGHAGFVAVDEPLSCRQCVRWHAKHWRFPEIPGRYEESWGIFMLLMDQQRVGMDILGLDYTVLPPAFDLLAIEDPARRRQIFTDLVVINHAYSAFRSRDRERKAKEKEGRARLGIPGGRRGGRG